MPLPDILFEYLIGMFINFKKAVLGPNVRASKTMIQNKSFWRQINRQQLGHWFISVLPTLPPTSVVPHVFSPLGLAYVFLFAELTDVQFQFVVYVQFPAFKYAPGANLRFIFVKWTTNISHSWYQINEWDDI